MSQENIDLVVGNLEAFNETGDVHAAFANADPEIEFEISTQAGREGYWLIETERGRIKGGQMMRIGARSVELPLPV